MINFSQKLIKWYETNQRNLPWRATDDAYKIWLSEIILQQTRVQQGLPYYEKFILTFPTVYDLAKASEDEVLKLWEGLGYYSRARNMHFAAKYIVTELNGAFPDNYIDLLKLKGVGNYTAAAIASFAFKETVAAVDGNVYRVLARIFGIKDDIMTNQAKKIFQSLANELIPKNQPDTFNQAIMDFGSMVCKPKQPLCEECFMQEECYAFRNNEITNLPVKSKKIKVKKRFFHFLLLENADKNIVIEQRSDNDIWKNLYQIPLIETNQEGTEESIQSEFEKIFSKQKLTDFQEITDYYTKHQLTHQQLHIRFFKSKIDYSEKTISPKDIQKYAFPIPLKNFFKKYYSQS
ncbi:MAG TPA: A/G-specific adenine glycosylase [Flavobacterium sp.]|nr:A/G-specific adenine glycosylase [Flavobacterium sp.]